jgi:hypothetical protein
LTFLSEHGRCEHCHREFEAELVDGVAYRYRLGEFTIRIELEEGLDEHFVCPNCVQQATSEAEFVG